MSSLHVLIVANVMIFILILWTTKQVLASCNGSKKLNNAKNYAITELEMLVTMDTH